MMIVVVVSLWLSSCPCVCFAGGSSPPYIGNGLGFWVTRKLHGCPYDISYDMIRLELDHHDAVQETPDRKYCSQATVV